MKLKKEMITQNMDGSLVMVSADVNVFSGIATANKTAAFIIEQLRTDTDPEAIKQATDTYIVNRFKDAEAYYTNALKDVQDRKAKLEKLKRRVKKPEGEQAARPEQSKPDAENKQS